MQSVEAATATVPATKEAIPVNAAAADRAIDADFAAAHRLLDERHRALKAQVASLAAAKQVDLVEQERALRQHHGVLARGARVATASVESGHTLHMLVAGEAVETWLRGLGERDWPEDPEITAEVSVAC